ncbi:PREDICTED: RPM1-interacting protein 4-like isoform X2 [Ipomoea nil]|uniref:RPM1-interacting protein 4-like isoform X2 n=1 Tax=Ipomoea nil TaxID=35883 RepID=UPI0009010CE9|nr:PREDICTED: RPM1-interacting protein 4-like isoform X2 [Ipomoea nil]
MTHSQFPSPFPCVRFSLPLISCWLITLFPFEAQLLHSISHDALGGYMQPEKARPLPKFGEWDVNNPASADGFTVIFAKARDEKKGTGNPAACPPPATRPGDPRDDDLPTKRRFCCF